MFGLTQIARGEDFEDPDTAYHLEAFYRWQPTKDLSLTPGFFLIVNPQHNRNLDPILIYMRQTNK